MRILAITTMFLLLSNLAYAQTLTETAGGQRVVDPNNYSTNSSFYGQAGATSPNNLDYHLYVQADEDLSPGNTRLDGIFLFRNPNSFSGFTSTFNRVGMILPDTTPEPGSTITTPEGQYYGHPSVFKDEGRYFLTSQKSITPWDFDIQMWGTSTDGEAFVWHPLLQYTGPDDEASETGNPDFNYWGYQVAITGVTVRGPITLADGRQYYWGFVDMGTHAAQDNCINGPYPADCSAVSPRDGLLDNPNAAAGLTNRGGVGAILIRKNTSDARGYDEVRLWSGGMWKTTGVNGEFDHTKIPDFLWEYIDKPKLHWLNDRWELWVSAHNGTPLCVADQEAGCAPATLKIDNHIVYRVVTPPTLSSAPGLGTQYDLQSNIRCMPSRIPNSRTYPFRVEGTSFLYSGSKNPFCNDNYQGMGVVVTSVQ